MVEIMLERIPLAKRTWLLLVQFGNPLQIQEVEIVKQLILFLLLVFLFPKEDFLGLDLYIFNIALLADAVLHSKGLRHIGFEIIIP